MIICKSESELELMREAGKIVARTHEVLKKAIEPGISTKELDAIAESYIRSQHAIPSFKGYNGFSGSICTSVNEQLVHGIPDEQQKLCEGDVISIDIGANYQGYHGDSAWTYPVGQISKQAQQLLDVTERSLYEGIKHVRPDCRLYTVSHAIQTCVEEAGFSIVREYVGHGIGTDLHEDPKIPNYGLADRGPRLKKGMVLAIEPMVTAGRRYVKTLADNWTVVTVDGSLCAHFEHTVAVTENGMEIFTAV